MSRVYLVVRHPMSLRGGISSFYEIIKVVESFSEGKTFCEKKNKNLNVKYHYNVKYIEVKDNVDQS